MLKHIVIKFFVNKNRIRNHIVFVDNDIIIFYNINPLTIGLPPEVFLEHIAHIGMVSHDDILV